MREDAIPLEETRVSEINDLHEYDMLHERHRIFPDCFENRNHKTVLDASAGVGVVGKRIKDRCCCDILCNDISPKCVKVMKRAGLETISFDIDNEEQPFPFPDGTFDALIALATIEHVIHIDHFVKELYRILQKDGFLYISAPNYSGILYLLPFLISGKTFHNPMSAKSRYEFYAHVRYFTFKTLIEFVSSFGFSLDTVYLPVPENSSRYQAIKAKSKLKAMLFRSGMTIMYKTLSPRWASEPVICFQKSESRSSNFRKIVL